MSLGALGKLPTLPDFVRAGPACRDVSALDRWLEAATAQAQREMGASFATGYPRLCHRFLFRPQDGEHALVGILRAAEDAHGRRYPFALYGLIPRVWMDEDPIGLLSIADALFPFLEDRIDDAVAEGGAQAVSDRLGVTVDLPAGWPDFPDRYEAFLDDVTCGDMVGPESEAGDELLSALIEVVSSHRRKPQAMPQGMVLPLNQPPFARALEIQFWTELMMILLHWYPQGLSWLWEAGAEATTLSSLVVCTRQPASHLLTSILDPRGILWRPWRDSPVTAARFTERVRVRLHPDHTLRELLEHLCPGYPEVCPWRVPQR